LYKSLAAVGLPGYTYLKEGFKMTEQQLAERRAMIEAACEGHSWGVAGLNSGFLPKAVSSPRKKRKTQHAKRKARKIGEGSVASALRNLTLAHGAGPHTLREIGREMGVGNLGAVLAALRRCKVPVVSGRLGPGVEMTPRVRAWCGLER
jgi:hypothetical protein